MMFLLGAYVAGSVILGVHMFGLREKVTATRVALALGGPITVPILLGILTVMYVAEITHD